MKLENDVAAARSSRSMVCEVVRSRDFHEPLKWNEDDLAVMFDVVGVRGPAWVGTSRISMLEKGARNFWREEFLREMSRGEAAIWRSDAEAERGND